MAASAWSHFIPYHVDPTAALQNYREQVFKKREYRLPHEDILCTDEAVLNEVSLDIPAFRRMLSVAKEIDKVFADLGADTAEQAKQTADVESFINRVEKDGFAAAAREAAQGSSQATPQSIDELRELAAEAGTHSILDIDHIAESPEFAAATPLSETQLTELFGTVHPTREMVHAVEKSGAFLQFCDGWDAVYFTVYDEGEPKNYFFAGVSGD